MFEELREFSAPITLNREACRLDHCVQRAWKNVRDAAPKSTATVNIQVAADHHCLVDELRMEQVFRNLFENAIGACESQPHIDVTSSLVNLHGQDAVRIVVRDNGPGFSEETRRKAFEPFFTTKSKGTGLGLAISKRIVEAHDGRMAIDASIHNGAAIKIAIPLLADPVPACAEKLRVPIGSV
jgi:signal transduction histidine kinase